jgi:hypothetical protein
VVLMLLATVQGGSTEIEGLKFRFLGQSWHL